MRNGVALLLVLMMLCSLSVCGDDALAAGKEKKEITTASAKETPLSDISVGSTLVFGNYEQDGNDNNGKEPIEWIVINIQDEKALLLSKDVLSATPYNKDNQPTTWEMCTLRSWLNEEFYNDAFSSKEKKAILLSKVSNGIEEQYPLKMDFGKDTKDRVFLLSYREVRDYMKTDYLRCCKASDALSAYGKMNNWYTRSPGEDTKQVRVVSANDGAIWLSWLNFKVVYPDVRSFNGVRPCVCVDLTSEPFAKNVKLLHRENQFEELEDRIIALSMPSSDLIGKTVKYGNYIQEGNSPEPIKWTILDVDGKHALLLSIKALDFRTYFSMDKAVTWEECTLRTWLNNEFLNSAFTAKEINGIHKSQIHNGRSEGRPNNVAGGNDTKDAVFLLSYQETNRYLPIDDMRRCAPSSYAVKQGLKEDNLGYSSWWLRSAGELEDEAMITNRDGSRSSDMVNFGYGVRPAMWVSLDALGL